MSLSTLLQRPGIQQFLKFCTIGSTSLVLDAAVSGGLIYLAHWNSLPAKALSFLFGVTNGFIWNSIWTFRGMGSGRRHEMYMKFLLVNVVGFCLNLLIFKSVLLAAGGHLAAGEKPAAAHFLLATGVAAVCVAFWNFFANKRWTFAGERTGERLEAA